MTTPYQVAQATSKTAKLEARREKVRTKDGAANLVHGLIDAQIAGITTAIVNMNRGIQVAEAAGITTAIVNMNRGIQVAEAGSRMVEAYDEDSAPPEPEFRAWDLSRFTTTTGSWP